LENKQETEFQKPRIIFIPGVATIFDDGRIGNANKEASLQCIY